MPPKSAKLKAVAVACGIIEHGDMFLAARRGPAQSNAGLWEFPGGKVRSDETAETALRRELREELDIEVSVTTQLVSHAYTYPWITINLIPFVCSITGGEPHPCEHVEIKWLDPVDTQSLPWTPADVPVLLEYRAYKIRS